MTVSQRRRKTLLKDTLHYHCRMVINRHLLNLDTHENLFLRIPHLGLHSSLVKDQLCDVSLDHGFWIKMIGLIHTKRNQNRQKSDKHQREFLLSPPDSCSGSYHFITKMLGFLFFCNFVLCFQMIPIDSLSIFFPQSLCILNFATRKNKSLRTEERKKIGKCRCL